MQPTFPSRYNVRVILVVLGLVAATLAVYWPITSHPFVAYDDEFYIVNNPMVTGGLSWRATLWAFTSFHEANWHPLTWLSHQLDVTLFGLAAGRHHLVNLLLHTTATLLLFALLRRLTGALWRPALVAALFALHPLHVESVAWAAERKDLLCALFVILSLLSYHRFARCGSTTAYWLALGLFGLALLAKPMAVTLPLLLLLLDWWPLARFDGGPGGWRRLLLEKVPFFALTLASSIVTVLAQKAGGAVVPLVRAGLDQRLANAAISAISYLVRMVWPSGLAPLYPFPLTIPAWQVWGATALLAAMAGLVLWQRRRRPWLAVGWCWYLVMLVPVSGLVQVGQQGMADRYTYLPLVGIFIVIAWWGGGLLGSWQYRQEVLGAVAVGWLVLLGAVARQQVGYWKDSETLFRRALAVTTDNFVMHHNLGNELERQGRLAEAVAEHGRAVALRPFSAESHYSLANALYRQGQYEAAVTSYWQAIRFRPDYVAAHNNLGVAYHALGRRAEAIQQYRVALRLDPADARARQNLQDILAEEGSAP